MSEIFRSEREVIVDELFVNEKAPPPPQAKQQRPAAPSSPKYSESRRGTSAGGSADDRHFLLSGASEAVLNRRDVQRAARGLRDAAHRNGSSRIGSARSGSEDGSRAPSLSRQAVVSRMKKFGILNEPCSSRLPVDVAVGCVPVNKEGRPKIGVTSPKRVVQWPGLRAASPSPEANGASGAGNEESTTRRDLRCLRETPIRIFVATWNMEYKTVTEAQLIPPTWETRGATSDRGKGRNAQFRKFPSVTPEELSEIQVLPHNPLGRSMLDEEEANKLRAKEEKFEETLREALRQYERDVEEDEPGDRDDDEENSPRDMKGGTMSKYQASAEIETRNWDTETGPEMLLSKMLTSTMSNPTTTKHSGLPPPRHTAPSLAASSLLSSAPVTSTEQKKNAATLSKDLAGDVSPLEDWLAPGYDLYVVALQEATGDALYRAIGKYLDLISGGRTYSQISGSKMCLSGYGDGAYFRKKDTSLAVFVADDVRWPAGPVKVGAEASTTLAGVEGGGGSKGACSIAFQIWQQTICFIGCHLPASSPQARLAARQHIRSTLGGLYGRRVLKSPRSTGGETKSDSNDSSPKPPLVSASLGNVLVACAGGDQEFPEKINKGAPGVARAQTGSPLVSEVTPSGGGDLYDVFDHVVWTGDFNHRMHKNASLISVLAKLACSDIPGLLAFDELQNENAVPDLYAAGFEEPQIYFLPSYKKRAGRPPFSPSALGDDPNANLQLLSKEYITFYQKRWYKGGKISAAVPAWCDRVMKRSQPNLRSVLCVVPGSYRAACSSVASVLQSSDHAPVGCGLSIYFANSAKENSGGGVLAPLHLPIMRMVARTNMETPRDSPILRTSNNSVRDVP